MKRNRSESRQSSVPSNSELLDKLLRTNTRSGDKDQEFDEYVMNSLQWCNDYLERIGERKQQAINYYILMFSALVGGVALIFATTQDEIVKTTSLTVSSALIGGFGVMTYLWILESESERISENFFLFWLHKYFHDKNPDLFETYGFHRMVYHYSAYDRRVISRISFAAYATFSILIIFSSFAIFICFYTGTPLLTGTTSGYNGLFISAVIGALLFIAMLAALIITIMIRERDRFEGKHILTNFHRRIHGEGKTVYPNDKPDA